MLLWRSSLNARIVLPLLEKLLPLFALVSCTQTEPQDHAAPTPPIPNIMESAWAGIRADIDRLETNHAHLDEWKRSSPEVEAIPSLPALMQNTHQLGLVGDAERRELGSAFAKSTSVFHFGYECDYHALVFFDAASKAWKVIKR